MTPDVFRDGGLTDLDAQFQLCFANIPANVRINADVEIGVRTKSLPPSGDCDDSIAHTGKGSERPIAISRRAREGSQAVVDRSSPM